MRGVVDRQAAMRPSKAPVDGVLDGLPKTRRDEAKVLMDLMARVTGETPAVWSRTIIGYGTYHYRYRSGRTGEAPLISFATSARHHAIYLIGDFAERHSRQLATLGKVRIGKGCLYVNRLTDVDLDVLAVLIDRSVRVRRGVDRAAARCQRPSPYRAEVPL